MDARKNLSQARALIPLLRSISLEINERRTALARHETLRHDLASDNVSNEGFISAIQDLDTAIATERRAIDAALKELTRLGLKVPSVRPLVVHIPGRTSRGDVVFSWEEGEGALPREVAETPK